MKISTALQIVLLPIAVFASAGTAPAITFFNNLASFNAATASSSFGFNSYASGSGAASFATAAGLTSNRFTFVGTTGNPSAPYWLSVAGPDFYYNDYNHAAPNSSLQAPAIVSSVYHITQGALTVTMPAGGVTAFGIQLWSVRSFDTTGAGTDTVVMTAGGASGSVVTPAFTGTGFLGFVSPTPITSVTITGTAAEEFFQISQVYYALVPTVCPTTLAQSSLSVGPATGASTLGVTAASTCSWGVTSDSYWLTPGNTAGTGNSQLPYTYFTNTKTGPRTGTLNVNGQTFSLTQSGNPASFANREVTLLYQSFLDREPDAGGLAYWSTQPAQNLGTAFYLSTEFQIVQQNLIQLYRAFSGTEPDYATQYLPGVAQLRTGAANPATIASSLVAAYNISSTSQLINLMCTNVHPGGTVAAVNNCVVASAGLQSLAPAAAALAFIASPQYEGVNSNQRDAVFLMYTITLNRPPDAGGFTYWLNTMTANNYDVYWLVTAFVISAEFQARLL